MTVLVASDLDRTLIYSRAAAGLPPAELVCVEERGGTALSFVTRPAAAGFASLSTTAAVIPVTTRSPDQFARVRLPWAAPAHAVVANGGILLVDGIPDERWARRIRRRLAGAAPLTAAHEHLVSACAPSFTRSVRTVVDLFTYAVVRREALPPDLVPGLESWAASRGWRVSLQGRKLYLIPQALRKSEAVAEIAARLGARTILAAGDALLDADLLLSADRGIRPAHGELHERGWTAPTVEQTLASGARAGEEIVAWFARLCAAEAPAQRLL